MAAELQDRRVRLALFAMAVLITAAAVWGAMESHYRSCVASAEARFPAVPVSAMNGTQTGPLKLSFLTERQEAVEGCGRLPF